jgi:hypothetical protein
MPSNTQSKFAEDQFMSRLWDNLMALPGIGTPEKGDRIAELRKLTDGRMLRAELEAKFPLGRSLSAQVVRLKAGLFAKATDPVTLAARVVLHLERLVETDADDKPISLMELNSLLNAEKELAQRYQRVCVLGLFSPTDWSEDAKAFIANDPPGSGWASEHVHPILIGAQVTVLQWDHHNERVQPYIETFCGLTLQERKKVCHDRLERAILVQGFAGLQAIADENGFSQDFVREVARDMASEDKRLTVKKVSGVGWVVKKRID